MARSGDGYHHGDLRNALLAAGRALLLEGGPAGLSLREVARRAGVSHAAPYRHFRSREALVAAIAEEGFAALSRAMVEAARGARTPRARLLRMGEGYVRFALGHPAEVRNMFSGAGLPASPALAAQARGTLQLLVDAVEAAQASGELAGGEALAVATTCWALVHGLALLLLQDALQPAGADARRALAVTRRTLRHLVEGLGR